MLDLLHLKIINLEHRDDRRVQCLDELSRIGLFNTSDSIFFKAKYLNQFGALGCSLSHAMVLSEFLFYENKPFALVLEDDFSIKNTDTFFDNIRSLLPLSNSWDVFLLHLQIPCE